MINMNENVVKINYFDKEIYLVKTAHVSKNSIEDVRNCVEEVKPDSICIELDQDRYNKLTNPEKWRETDIVKVIKEKQVGFLLVNVILSSFQKRMAKTMDSNSGAEMLEGINLSKENNINLVMADRPIKTTFSRIWNKLSFKEKIHLLSSSITSIFDDEEITEEDIAKLKEADALEAALLDIGKEFPTVKEVLVDERDKFLCEKIRTAPGNKIVAIIGAAHSIGINKYINEPINCDDLNIIDKKTFTVSNLLKWLLSIALVGIVIYTTITNKQMGVNQLKSWVLWHGSLSAIGTSLALAHPLSIITAFIAAPITSLSPLLAPGWFAGIVEATIRKPKVKDFEDLADDTATLKGFWKNRVTKILFVVIFANLFSTLATFISGLDIIKKFIDLF